MAAKKPTTPKFKPPVTKEEIIEEAIKSLKRRSELFGQRDLSPPGWNVHIGHQVHAGGHLDPVVIEKRDDDRVIVFEYTRLKERSREPLDRYWSAMWWWDVFPQTVYQGQQFAHRNAWNSYIQTPVDSLLYKLCEEEFRDNPDYQRDYVWTIEDKKKFIASIFEGRELGRFVFIRYPYPDNATEVLDGKQRLNALKEFVFGKFTHRARYWFEFSSTDRAVFETQMVQFVELDGGRFKRSELLKIFLEVNAGGVPQKEEHLDRVREMYLVACKEEGTDPL